MILSKFLSLFKSKSDHVTPIVHSGALEIAYIEGFDRGFDTAIKFVSDINKETKDKIRQQAINETIERLNANK